MDAMSGVHATYATACASARTRLCTKSLDRALLCATSVSSVSLWLMNSEVKPHHRDTEDTEVAQRNPRTRTFWAKSRY